MLSFHHISSASPLLPQTSSSPTWAFHIPSITLLHHYSSFTTVFLFSKSSHPLSSLLFCHLLRGKGVFSVRAQSIQSCSVFCLTSSFPPHSPLLFPTVCLSLNLTVTWIGSVENTPSHWTRYSYTHVDPRREPHGTTCVWSDDFPVQLTRMSTTYTHKNKWMQTVQAILLHNMCRSSIPQLINLRCIYSMNEIKNPHTDKPAMLKITPGGKQRHYFCYGD